MKSLQFIFILLIASLTSKAQSLIVKDVNGNNVSGDTLSVIFHPTNDHGWTELAIYLFPQNIGNDTLLLGAKKTEYNINADEYHAFCFAGTCFLNTTYVSPYNDKLPPQSTDSTFSGHYRFDDLLHVPGICLVAYTFYNINNPNDSAIVYVRFNTLLQIVGVVNFAVPNFKPLIWPNPSSEFINIEPNQSTCVIIDVFSASGTHLLRFNRSSGLNISGLPKGSYYILITINNRTLRSTFYKL